METPIILVIGGAIFAVLYIWQRVSFWRKRIHIETNEAVKAVDDSFNQLMEKVESQIEMLDNQPGLSEEERQIRDSLFNAISSSKQVIEKEIKDIKDQI